MIRRLPNVQRAAHLGASIILCQCYSLLFSLRVLQGGYGQREDHFVPRFLFRCPRLTWRYSPQAKTRNTETIHSSIPPITSLVVCFIFIDLIQMCSALPICAHQFLFAASVICCSMDSNRDCNSMASNIRTLSRASFPRKREEGTKYPP